MGNLLPTFCNPSAINIITLVGNKLPTLRIYPIGAHKRAPSYQRDHQYVGMTPHDTAFDHKVGFMEHKNIETPGHDENLPRNFIGSNNKYL